MDISAFSADSFDVKVWINDSLKNVKDKENKSAYVGSMVKKLQLFVQQVNSGLEEISEQVVVSLPRIIRDANVLSQEASMLQQKMSSVKQEIIEVEKSTRSSMASLERLDKIKSQLLIAKQSLHEADNWTLMTTEIEQLFENGDIEMVASKIVSLQQCLSILANTPDFEEKRLQLETLKNRLEAIASPQLVQAFASKGLENAQKFVGIFSSMERLTQLLVYYNKCQKNTLCEKWKNLQELDDLAANDIIKQFYDFLLIECQTQLRWCSQLFPSDVASNILMAKLLIDVLDTLKSSMADLILSSFKEHSNPLILLQDIQTISFYFDNEIHKLIFNDSCLGDEDIKYSENLKSVIHAPYSPNINNLAPLLYDSMKNQLIKHEEDEKDDLLDQIEALEQLTAEIFNVLNDACAVCFKLSKGCVVTQLIDSSSKCLAEFLNPFTSVSKQITQKFNEDSSDTWIIFQLCLAFLQRLGDVLNQITTWNQHISTQVTEHRSEAADLTKLYLTKDKHQQFNSFLVLLEQGDSHQFLPIVIAKIEKICKNIHQITYQVIFNPISGYINKAQSSWNQNTRQNMPDYSFTPQEYVTQIGEYLLTLPQHLEPFLLHENPCLNLALALANNEYKQEGCSANILLSMLARGTCQAMCDRILSITSLSQPACKQLVTDIDYLSNVLEELGVELTESLQQILTLLRLEPQNYQTQSVGISHRIVASIREMRGIV